jgi:hypothetical protein
MSKIDHDIVKHGFFNRDVMRKPDELVYPDDENHSRLSLRVPLGWQYGLRHQSPIKRLFEQPSPSKAGTQLIEDLVETCLVELFENRDVVYPSDIVAALDLDYDLVDNIFAKFVRQGKLKE